MGNKLSDNDKKYLMALKPEDITFELLISLFADKTVKEIKNNKLMMKVISSKMKPSDEFTLKAKEYFNKEEIITTAGQFIYNKLLIERDFAELLGYIHQAINKDVHNSLEDKLSKALLNDKITVKQMVDYLNRVQWLSQQFHSVISGSFTMGTLKPNKEVIKKRDQLLKENKDKLKKGDATVAAKIEKELLSLAKEKLKGDHGLDLYDSGARGSFGNNFKNITIMKGPTFNPTTGEFDIVQSNFMEGIKKTELETYGNAIISGSYPKAVGTQVSGEQVCPCSFN